jgi:hypothetical protein
MYAITILTPNLIDSLPALEGEVNMLNEQSADYSKSLVFSFS